MTAKETLKWVVQEGHRLYGPFPTVAAAYGFMAGRHAEDVKAATYDVVYTFTVRPLVWVRP